MATSKGRGEEAGDTSARDPIAVEPGKLRTVKPGELLLRFAFGAGISAVAAVISIAWGPKAGGLFLAFPAILPASLTLVEDKQSTERASADVKGGSLGGVGMAAFAVTVLLMGRGLGPLCLAIALGVWTVVSAGLYMALRKRRFFSDA